MWSEAPLLSSRMSVGSPREGGQEGDVAGTEAGAVPVGWVPRPEADPRGAIKADLTVVPRAGRYVVVLSAAAVGFDAALPMLDGLEGKILSGQRVALTGLNGCGKTTLLRTIVGYLPILVGAVRIGPGVRMAYLDQEQRDLESDATALALLLRAAPMEEGEARTFLHRLFFFG